MLLLVAGAKLLDVEAFMHTLREWRLLPPATVPAVAFVVPVLELWLALCWFAGHGRPRIVIWTCVTLVAYTLAYAGEMAVRGDPPACACLGIWEKHLAELAAGRYVLLRNAVLLVVVSSCGLVAFPRNRVES